MAHVMIGGATAVGLVFRDGVILAAEKRMTYGGFIAAKSVKKVFKITESVGAACAGWVADMQELVKTIRFTVSMRELEFGVKSSVGSIAKLTSVVLRENKLYPLMTQVIIGGYVAKPQVFSLDPLGSLLEDKYIAVGTGAEMATGLLETEYKDDLGEDEARGLVIRSIKAAVGRDATSGDGVDLLIFSKDGTREESIMF